MARVSDIRNFRSIGDALATGGQPTEAQLQAAAAEGYQVVINLALHDDPRYSLADETGLVEGLGMVYVHIPVRFDAPRKEDLLAFFRAMDAHRGRKTLVHCAANLRVTAFLGLYRALCEGTPLPQAFAPMHSVWEPDPVWAKFIADILAQRPAPPRSPA